METAFDELEGGPATLKLSSSRSVHKASAVSGAAPVSTVAPPPFSRRAEPACNVVGFMACGLTGVLLMYANTGWVDKAFIEFVIPHALCQGGVVQLLAAIWSLVRGHMLDATFHMLWGGFWLAWGTLRVLRLQGVTWGPTSPDYATAQCLFLMEWTIVAIVMFLVARHKRPFAVRFAFGSLAVALALLALTPWTAAVGKIGAYVGMLSSSSFFYAGAAQLMFEVNSVRWWGMSA
eukprot:TRINITY_DN14705_c0_g1_i1.p2 TRINITY_DN14705_c0_g1~~TRINITY_DN14705_c0_g1_i1.p2  ORF type:complete len:234 (+),score=70.27 TRINITY_DN14705_c0_g1_i1:136-837(+)